MSGTFLKIFIMNLLRKECLTLKVIVMYNVISISYNKKTSLVIKGIILCNVMFLKIECSTTKIVILKRRYLNRNVIIICNYIGISMMILKRRHLHRKMITLFNNIVTSMIILKRGTLIENADFL